MPKRNPTERHAWRYPGQPEFNEAGQRLRIRHPTSLKERLCEEQNHRCCLCGGRFYEPLSGVATQTFADCYPTFEHIVDFGDGGSDDWENLAVSHSRCNNLRNHQKYRNDSYRAKLRRALLKKRS